MSIHLTCLSWIIPGTPKKCGGSAFFLYITAFIEAHKAILDKGKKNQDKSLKFIEGWR